MKLFLTSLLLAAALGGQQNTVFRRNVFNGVTTAQAAAALPNIGQAVHIVTLIYPSALADVTGFTFRVEASFDNTTYFPISEDITEAKYNGSYAYAISRCNGVYPYVRFRLVAANASYALTAHYTGSLQPIGIVKFSTDRYVADSPLAGVTVTWPGQVIGGNYYVDNKRMTPITPSQWTSVNFSATVTRFDGEASISLSDTYLSDQQWKFVCRALPSFPYTIRAHWLPEIATQEGASPTIVGVALRNSSTGEFIAWGFGGVHGGSFYHQKWTSPSVLNSLYTGQTWRSMSGLGSKSIQITDDGTTRSYLMWNGKYAYSPLAANNAYWGTGVPRTDFTTPNQVCFGLRVDNNNYNNFGTFVGYDVNPTW